MRRNFSCLSQSTRLTDRQTDRWKDSFLVDRPRCMQCMQRGKKNKSIKWLAKFDEYFKQF